MAWDYADDLCDEFMAFTNKHAVQGIFEWAQDDVAPPWFQLWALRILVRLGGVEQMSTERRPELLQWSDICHWLDVEMCTKRFGAADTVRLKKAFGQRHLELEALYPDPDEMELPEALSANAQRLGELLGLSYIAGLILIFRVLLEADGKLANLTELLGELHNRDLMWVLAVILGSSERFMRRALVKNGHLYQSGLIKLDPRILRLSQKLDLPDGEFAEHMLDTVDDPMILFRHQFRVLPAPELTLADYAHARTDIHVLRAQLAQALKAREAGVNIFIYGRPGTGKSQFAQVLAQALDVPAFGVASEGLEGDPVDGELRLRALRAAQAVLHHCSAILVFDEAEDVFNGSGEGFFSFPGVAQRHKGWPNGTRAGSTACWKTTRCPVCGSPTASTVSIRPLCVASIKCSSWPCRRTDNGCT